MTYLLNVHLDLFVSTEWLQDNICNMVHGLCFCKTAHKYSKERALVLKHVGHLYLEFSKFLSDSSDICEVYLTQFNTLLFMNQRCFHQR